MKKLIGVVCALAMVGAGTAAWAGLKYTQDSVYISFANRLAMGSLGGVRNSADPNEYIEVTIDAYPNGSTSVTIYAKNTSNQLVTCTSNAPSMVAAAQSLGTDSFILFTWDANNNCTYFGTRVASYLAPKNH